MATIPPTPCTPSPGLRGGLNTNINNIPSSFSHANQLPSNHHQNGQFGTQLASGAVGLSRTTGGAAAISCGRHSQVASGEEGSSIGPRQREGETEAENSSKPLCSSPLGRTQSTGIGGQGEEEQQQGELEEGIGVRGRVGSRRGLCESWRDHSNGSSGGGGGGGYGDQDADAADGDGSGREEVGEELDSMHGELHAAVEVDKPSVQRIVNSRDFRNCRAHNGPESAEVDEVAELEICPIASDFLPHCGGIDGPVVGDGEQPRKVNANVAVGDGNGRQEIGEEFGCGRNGSGAGSMHAELHTSVQADEPSAHIVGNPRNSGDESVVGDGEQHTRAILEREFGHHHPGVARLNNGSFGSAPKRVLDDQAQWNMQWLQHPDAFVWSPLSDGFLATRQGLADMIGAPNVDEVVLLENATTGAAVVAVDCMWGFLEGRYSKGDSILMFDSTYGAVKNCFQGYCMRAGARLFEYKLPFPVTSNEHILSSFEAALQKEKADHPTTTTRLAVLDHITSMPSIILPIRELVNLCRKYGVEQVFVDGAHAIGNTDIDVQEIDADYYVANVHKWLFAPPVVAFFHSQPHHLTRLHHPVVSHSYGTGLLNESYWVGTRDYSAFLAVPAAIKFVKDFFGDVDTYKKSNHDKVMEMAEMLTAAWGTCLGAPAELFASMAMVGLPSKLNIHSQEDALNMRTRLREDYHVEVPLYYAGNNPLHLSDNAHSECHSDIVAYARISHQVYNKPEDYLLFRDAIKSIMDRC